MSCLTLNIDKKSETMRTHYMRRNHVIGMLFQCFTSQGDSNILMLYDLNTRIANGQPTHLYATIDDSPSKKFGFVRFTQRSKGNT